MIVTPVIRGTHANDDLLNTFIINITKSVISIAYASISCERFYTLQLNTQIYYWYLIIFVVENLPELFSKENVQCQFYS